MVHPNWLLPRTAAEFHYREENYTVFTNTQSHDSQLTLQYFSIQEGTLKIALSIFCLTLEEILLVVDFVILLFQVNRMSSIYSAQKDLKRLPLKKLKSHRNLKSPWLMSNALTTNALTANAVTTNALTISHLKTNFNLSSHHG